MAVPGTKIAVVGTPLTFNDLLAELSEMEKNKTKIESTKEGFPISKRGYVYLKYRAIHEFTGEALWPEVRPLDWLEGQRRELGEIMFAREYLCEPMSDAGALFDNELLGKCERDKELMGITRGGDIYGGVDLARSLKPNSSQTVYIL